MEPLRGAAATLCHPNPGHASFAVLSTSGQVLLGLASGDHVLITSVEQQQVLQLLGPMEGPVNCVAFCNSSSRLAAGATHAVVVHGPTEGTSDDLPQWSREAVLEHPDMAVHCLAWMAAAAGRRPSASSLWVGGESLVLWCATSESEWSRTWSRPLSQPVRHMAASTHSSLLATAGEHDRLVKIWRPAPSAGQGGLASGGGCDFRNGVEFSYLRHPSPVVSLEWRPPERTDPLNGGGDGSSYGGSGGDGGDGGDDGIGGASESILLTSCVDGDPRLWRVTALPEPEPLRMFLCATLTTDGSGCEPLHYSMRQGAGSHEPPLVGQGAGVHVPPLGTGARDGAALQWVQWLRPTFRPRFPLASSTSHESAACNRDHDVRLSPGLRPASSPILSPGLSGVPTLRPSLCERHDYLVATLADGTLLVWLLLGLSAAPRCAPKIVVWACLPRVLPPVPRVLRAAAFCNFERPPLGPSTEPSAGGGSRCHERTRFVHSPDDQLPSALSVVQHTSDAESPIRLCAVNVERGATGERVQQRRLGGHTAVATTDVVMPLRGVQVTAAAEMPHGATPHGPSAGGVGNDDATGTRAAGAGSGRRGGAIHLLQAHPTCPLAVTVDVSGRSLLWHSPAFASSELDLPPFQSPIAPIADGTPTATPAWGEPLATTATCAVADGSGVPMPLREVAPPLSTTRASPSCLLRFHGCVHAATWLPSSTVAAPELADAPPRLLAFEATRALLYTRTVTGVWTADAAEITFPCEAYAAPHLASSASPRTSNEAVTTPSADGAAPSSSATPPSPPVPEPVPARGVWLCVHAFPKPLPPSDPQSHTRSSHDGAARGKQGGFAVNGTTAWTLVWTVCDGTLELLGGAPLHHSQSPSVKATDPKEAADADAPPSPAGHPTIRCARPLPRLSASEAHPAAGDAPPSATFIRLGSLLCGYSDGAVCNWELRRSVLDGAIEACQLSVLWPSIPAAVGAGGAGGGSGRDTSGDGDSEVLGVCALDVSRGDLFRAAVLSFIPSASRASRGSSRGSALSTVRAVGYGGPSGAARGDLASCGTGLQLSLQIVEYDSSAPAAGVEFSTTIDPASAPPTLLAPTTAPVASSGSRASPRGRVAGVPPASVALVERFGAMPLVALGCGHELRLYAPRQSGGSRSISLLQWGLQGRIRLPGEVPCSALGWAPSGALLVGAGALVLVCADILQGASETLTSDVLPQWHPSTLQQQYLANPSRADRLLRHLATLPSLAAASPLPLSHLLGGDEASAGALTTPRRRGAAMDTPTEPNFFAPSDNPFAPSLSALDAFATLGGDSSCDDQPPSSASSLGKVPLGPAGQLLQRLRSDGADEVQGLPNLSVHEEAALVRLLKARAAVEAAGAALDAAAARFALYAFIQGRESAATTTAAAAVVPSAAIAWALLSDCQTTLVELCLKERGGERDWPALRSLGTGIWLPNGETLRQLIDGAAKAHFVRRKDPQECALLYLALGKKTQLQALCKAVRNDKLHGFLAKDFTLDHSKVVARKNAHSLLSKQQVPCGAVRRRAAPCRAVPCHAPAVLTAY